MFLTRPKYEGFLPKFPGYEDCKRWEMVELAADLPWYKVELRQGEKASQAQHVTLLVGRADLVEQMLRAPGEASQVTQLHMARPGAYARKDASGDMHKDAGNDAWDLRQILRMWRATLVYKGKPFPVFLFDLQGRGIVVDPPSPSPASVVHHGELLYEFVPAPNAPLGSDTDTVAQAKPR